MSEEELPLPDDTVTMTTDEYRNLVLEALVKITDSLIHMGAAQLKQAGMANAYFDEAGALRVEPPLPPEPKLVEGKMSVHGASSGPLAWVSVSPPPFNNLEILCFPDDSAIGITCSAIMKLPGNQRKKYAVRFEEV
jgi:hypothetical protein